MKRNTGRFLEKIYCIYNRREYVDPDPILFLYEYEGTDREIAALVASSLAYGRVGQILKSVRNALDVMGKSPSAFLDKNSESQIHAAFSLFKHRFTTGEDLARLLCGARKALRRCGTLENAFLSGYSAKEETLLPAVSKFSYELCAFFPNHSSSLLPSPEKGSACKRLNLMLRWLVRSDAVDPGGWDRVPKSRLLVPLDTHMFRIAGELGFHARMSANLDAALEITRAFASYAPDDPVKYDFALTRFGIHPLVSGEKLPLLRKAPPHADKKRNRA